MAVLLQWKSCEGKEKREKLHDVLRCFIREQVLKLSLEETNPPRRRDQIFCQSCQSAFFKINVSPGKFTQLKESRSAVPAGCLLPALPSPLSADVWGGGEAQAVVAHLLISHLLCSEVSWQGRFDLDQAQTHFCWISPSTWCDVLQLWVSWPRYVSLELTHSSGLGKKVPRIKVCH